MEKFGAKIVALPIDDSGIPQDAESRIALSEELIEKINKALAELKADGTYDKLLEKWGLN